MKHGPRRLAGVDWASKAHAVSVVEADGGVRAWFDIPDSGKSLAGRIKCLAKLRVGDIAIERPDGPLAQAMLEESYRVLVIAPAMLKTLRQRYGATGAKSDPGDA